MTELPDSAYPTCASCGGPVRESSRMLHEIVGYERHRVQGGTNHVINRQRTGRVICADCAERVQRGDNIEQGRLTV